MNRTEILAWYTGKALANAAAALDLLEASVSQGCWPPGLARQVKAAISKPSVAIKYAKAHQNEIGHQAYMKMRWYACAPTHNIDWTQVDAYAALTVNRFIQDFAPVAAAIDRLDRTRPKPVFTELGVSPTVTKTLVELGFGAGASLKVAPIKYFELQRVLHDGTIQIYHVGRIVWPKGTMHEYSRHAQDDRRFYRCHACGHAIKNPYNWVPLLVDTGVSTGNLYSLWTGRDCAQKLLGIKMTGDLELEKRK